VLAALSLVLVGLVAFSGHQEVVPGTIPIRVSRSLIAPNYNICAGKIKTARCLSKGCMLISAKKNPAGGTKGVAPYDLGCVAASTPGPGPYPPKAAASTGSSASTTTATPAVHDVVDGEEESSIQKTTAATAPDWEGDDAIIVCSQMKGTYGDWNYFDKSVLAKAGLVDDEGNTLINHVQATPGTNIIFYRFEGKFGEFGTTHTVGRFDVYTPALTSNAYLPDKDFYGNPKTKIWQFAVASSSPTEKLANSCEEFKDV